MKNDGERTGKIIVHIDKDLKKLIPQYLKNRRNDAHIIVDALERGDYETIETVGHTMKGSGGGYGFETITTIGLTIETAAMEKSTEQICTAVEELYDYLNRLEIIYE